MMPERVQKTTSRDNAVLIAAEKAAKAGSDLVMVAAVKALCENSLFQTKSGSRFARRIVAACRTEAQRQYLAYQKAMTEASQ